MSSKANNEKSTWKAVFVTIGLLVAGMIVSFVFFDEPVVSWLEHRPFKFSHHILEEAFQQLGKVFVIIWLLLFWVWTTGKHKTVLLSFLAMIIVFPAVWSVKAVVQRPRPHDVAKARVKTADTSNSPRRWSFPSGDTATVFAAGTVLASSAARSGVIGIAICCSTVGVLRVLDLAHYPSDIFAGAAIGVFCGWAAIRIRNRTPKIENALKGKEQALSFAGIFIIPPLSWFFQGPDKLNILLTFYTPAAAAISLAGWMQSSRESVEHVNTVHTEQMRKQGDWFFRWRTFLPLMIAPVFLIELRNFSYPEGSHLLDRLWEMLCFAISLFGLGIRIYTVGHVPEGTSGRTTSGPKAAELNTTGMYSITRHPLYLANFVIWVGVVLVARSISLAAFCILAFFIFHERIILAEEQFLLQKFGAVFAEWAGKTPMIIPRFKNWRKPSLPFSPKTVLKREYTTFFTVAALFTLLEVGGDLFYKGKWEFEWTWVLMFSFASLTYIVLRTLKKNKKLDVEGR